MRSKIEQAFENIHKKLGQKGHELSNQNGPEVNAELLT